MDTRLTKIVIAPVVERLAARVLDGRRLTRTDAEALAELPDVAVVSSQFGFEFYAEHLHELRGRLAVESFYGDAYRYVCERCGSFAEWAREFVPRFKDASGLVLYCQVESVEEARAVWSAWERAHQGNGCATAAGTRSESGR